MCQIIYKPCCVKLDEEELKDAFLTNKDGIGFMFWDEQKLVLRKFMSFKKFLVRWRSDIKLYPKSDFVIHFRFERTEVEISQMLSRLCL